MTPRELHRPASLIAKEDLAIRAAVEHRKEHGIPDGEHPLLTYLYSDLLWTAHLCELLAAFFNASSDGQGAAFLQAFEKTCIQNEHRSPSWRLRMLWRALSAEDPATIPDGAIRRLVMQIRADDAANDRRGVTQ